MPIVPATATRRHFRSCAVCALVGLVAAAAVGSLFISVEPVGSIPRTTALSAAPYARWLHVSPLKASSEHGDAEAPAEGCRTPVRVRKVALCFLVRHAPHHNGIWRSWLASAAGLVPAADAHTACCAPMARRLRRALLQEGGVGADDDAQQDDGDDQRLFTVYVHDKTGSPEYEPGDVYFGHRIGQRVETDWGRPSLTVATQLLLRAALEDAENERFVLLDETAVPLYPAPATYLLLIGETRSRMRGCEHQVTDVRWDESLAADGFEARHWRKSSQWATFTRRHAELVAADELVIGRMALRCSTVNGTCVTDEHHAPTVLALAGLSNETTCVSNTVQVLWKPTNVRSPYRYQPGDATKETLEGIRKRGAHCRPELTLMAAERGGNFVPTALLRQFSCLPKDTSFMPPFEADWPPAVNRNLNCSVFSRKWSEAASPRLYALMQDMAILPPADA